MTTTTAGRTVRKDDKDEIFYPVSDGKPMAETEKHRDLMIYSITALQAYFDDQPHVYVSGNNFLYFERDNPQAVVSPDCYVVFGVEKRQRDIYKLWEEGDIRPVVVFEMTSKKTRREDQNGKKTIYEQILQVKEYFQFDPTGDYLKPRLQGFQLENGRYVALPLINGRLYSTQLGLEIANEEARLHFYAPGSMEPLPTPLEQARRAVRSEQLARSEALRAQQETIRAQRELHRANAAIQQANEERQRAEAANQRADEEAQRAEQEAQRANVAEAKLAKALAALQAANVKIE